MAYNKVLKIGKRRTGCRLSAVSQQPAFYGGLFFGKTPTV
jgi:hypothetical protein